MFFLNLSTTIAWFSFFLALKYSEPLLVATVSCAVGPLLTANLNRFFRMGSPVNQRERIAAWGIFVALGLVLWLTLLGKSGVGKVSPFHGVVGFISASVCGVAITTNTFFSKKLAERSFETKQVMALRFWLLVSSGAVTLSLMRGSFLPESREEILAILLIAVISHVLGLSLLQKAIERLEPITVSLALAAAPFFTLPFQWLDNRLLFSVPSIAISSLVVVLVAMGILSRSFEGAPA